MNKILPFLVVLVLVLTGLEAVSISMDDKTCFVDSSVISLNDELDQYQTEISENLTVPIGQIRINESSVISLQAAQSFIPTKEIITRVEILIIKNATATYPLVVSIRKELKEEDLTYVNIDPEQVSSEQYNWIDANFNDTRLTPGQTYYIVVITENTTENYYGWRGNNTPESYPLGCFWYSIDDGNTWDNRSSSNQNNMAEWVYQNNKPRFDEYITWDMCFKTYGRQNLAPSAPSIVGETKGKTGTDYLYTFNAVDPDIDDVKYIIDWGDENSDTTGFHPSGIDVKLSHSWSEKGTYIVKVKAEDLHGLAGPEATLEVTMPRNKISDFNFFQRFSNLFSFIQKILALLI